MTVYVPTLEGSLYLTDPEQIIGYILKRYFRDIKKAVPFLDDYIISLPKQVAQFGREPAALVTNIQSDLQKCFDRIFAPDGRKITVSVSQTAGSTPDNYNVTMSIMYTTLSGDLLSSGTVISLVNGQLVIPADKLTVQTIPV
jgi:hypothetical protein